MEHLAEKKEHFLRKMKDFSEKWNISGKNETFVSFNFGTFLQKMKHFMKNETFGLSEKWKKKKEFIFLFQPKSEDYSEKYNILQHLLQVKQFSEMKGN